MTPPPTLLLPLTPTVAKELDRLDRLKRGPGSQATTSRVGMAPTGHGSSSRGGSRGNNGGSRGGAGSRKKKTDLAQMLQEMFGREQISNEYSYDGEAYNR